MTELTPLQEEGLAKMAQERAELIKSVLSKHKGTDSVQSLEDYKKKLVEEEIKRVNSNGKRKK